jgi:phosphatidylglycerol:prolipoprotein diacylglycerol transferase
MVYLGLVFGLVAGNYAARLMGLDPFRVFVAMLILTIPAFVGGRLLFVATHWQLYRQDLSRIWRRSEGGGRLYGGLPFTFLLSLPLLSALEVPFWSFWDAVTVTILVGVTIGRFGCLLNGCCAGRPTTSRLGLNLADYQGVRCRRIPTQLLEIASTATLLAGAVLIWGRVPFAGTIFLYALGGYGTARFLLEPTRAEQDEVEKIAIYRVTSAALVVTSIITFLIRWLST